MFTIHNIAYQGSYPRELMNYTGFPQWLYNPGQLEHYGLNFLKAGVVFADAVTTVSPTYSREIQTREFGEGLEGLLTSVHWKLSGIVNGCDYEHWNPVARRSARFSSVALITVSARPPVERTTGGVPYFKLYIWFRPHGS